MDHYDWSNKVQKLFELDWKADICNDTVAASYIKLTMSWHSSGQWSLSDALTCVLSTWEHLVLQWYGKMWMGLILSVTSAVYSEAVSPSSDGNWDDTVLALQFVSVRRHIMNVWTVFPYLINNKVTVTEYLCIC